MFLKRKRQPDAPARLDLRWETVAASATDAHPTAIDDLFAQRFDGMTISGVFDAAEVDRALPILNSHRLVATEEVFGSMLGIPLTQVADGADRGPHVEDAARCGPLYREAFGFDPFERIARVMAPMGGGRRLTPPLENGRAYNPGNVRWYDPGAGGLKAHVGNEFRSLHENGAMSHLIETTRIADHLSYFVMLQPAESGGALTVYDLLWETYRPDGREEWYALDNLEFESYPSMQVELAPGEMVMFGGGWRWHRVDEIGGTVPRITYGGFAAPSVDDRELNFWC